MIGLVVAQWPGKPRTPGLGASSLLGPSTSLLWWAGPRTPATIINIFIATQFNYLLPLWLLRGSSRCPYCPLDFGYILTESENNLRSQHIFCGGAAVLKEKIFFRAENIFVFARHFDNKCRPCSAQAGQKLEMMASNWETRVPRY